MFGVSFTEAVVIGLVALVFVGPQKLPKMMRTVGEWVAKLRRMTQDVRAQTGIDDVLRAEGIEGGLSELRSMLRGDFPIARGLDPARPAPSSYDDPYAGQVDFDRWREWPTEGCDAYGALPDDLIDEEPAAALPANGASSPSTAEA